MFRVFPKGYQEAIADTLKYEDNYFVKTNWEMNFYPKLATSKKIQTFALYGRTVILQLKPLKQNEHYLQKLIDYFQEHPIFLFHPLKALSPALNTKWYLDQISPTMVRWSWNSNWGEAALRFIILPDKGPSVIQSYYFYPKGLIGMILGAFFRPFHRRWLKSIRL